MFVTVFERLGMDPCLSAFKKVEDFGKTVSDRVHKLLVHGEHSRRNERVCPITLEADHLRGLAAQWDPTCAYISEFYDDVSVWEIKEATQNFHRSMKIGEGGYGNIYIGCIRNNVVAMKVLKPDSSQGAQEYNQEVEFLNKLRHPNIVALIGVCAEASALIYEYVPNGSLKDRLRCKEGSPPLSCEIRMKIIREIASVLKFFQSSEPQSVVHGDLKPENILLDSRMSCKVSDFGLCRGLELISKDKTRMRFTCPKGTPGYMDPHFHITGELTQKSDLYCFGLIILQLLTGKPALNIRNVVQSAVKADNLRAVLDASAGEWPFDEAKRVTFMALRCCEMDRQNRPDVEEVWNFFCGRGIRRNCRNDWREEEGGE